MMFRIVFYMNITALIFMVRFVDDGTGGWCGEKSELIEFLDSINRELMSKFDIELTFKVTEFNEYIEILDVQYKFDIQGNVTTDIFIKPTDAHQYLNYSSHHPRHTFRSIVYSQGLRYRCIISDNATLAVRLDCLAEHFINCNYPKNLVVNILNDIKLYPDLLNIKILITWVKVSLSLGSPHLEMVVQT